MCMTKYIRKLEKYSVIWCKIHFSGFLSLGFGDKYPQKVQGSAVVFVAKGPELRQPWEFVYLNICIIIDILIPTSKFSPEYIPPHQ